MVVEGAGEEVGVGDTVEARINGEVDMVNREEVTVIQGMVGIMIILVMGSKVVTITQVTDSSKVVTITQVTVTEMGTITHKVGDMIKDTQMDMEIMVSRCLNI